jgi:ATP-binding cassette, subfamily B, bacterial
MLGALWPHVAAHRNRVALAALLLILAKAATVAVPIALKLVVDALGERAAPVAAPVALLLAYALLRFAGTLFGEFRDLVFARVTHEAMADFHARAFAHVLGLGARFHAGRETGRIARDIERGVAGIGFLLGVTLMTIVPTLVEILAVMGILVARYSVWFSAIVALSFACYTGWTVYFTEQRAVHQRRLNELDSRASARLVDSLLNFEAVKAHANEPIERRRYGGLLGDWMDVGLRNQRALSQLHIGQSAIIAVGVALIMLIAGHGVVAGTMTVGDLVLVNAYVIQICLPLNALGFVFRQARDALVNAEKLAHLLAEQPEVVDAPGAPAIAVTRGEVRFERVSFGYVPERRVLDGIDLVIPPGTTLAVVGASGSGKSTLARLLLRLYDPDEGRVLIDAQDVRRVTQTSLRAAIGLVPQDTALFNDTIAWNIGYGRAGATREDIVQAARAARIHDFIATLPQGYDTMAGERGVKLSGGEKQRIAIARVILRNPPILVFDEATSALDARAERAIEAELDRIAKNRTALVIAHRLSSIVNAHQIVVLEHGRIVERGAHAELISRGGVYAQMWALQQQERALRQAEGEHAVRRYGERRRSA